MEAPPNNRLQDRYPNLVGSVFVVTYGRTGSTLLQRIMQTIPGSCVRGENHNMFESLWESAMRGRRTVAKWGEAGDDPTHPWFGANEINREGYGAAMVDAFVDHVLQPPQDVRWIGFKEIRYGSFGDRLDDVLNFMNFHFPNAHFLFNGRAVEDVQKSGWWKNWNPQRVRDLVEGCDRRFASYHADHPDNTFRTSYEEFTGGGHALRPFFEQLGEPYDEAQVDAILSRQLTH